MNIEYEATFYPINKNQMRLKLKKTGAKLIKKEFLMKRTVFNPPIPIKEGWLRVRNEGDKITMSLKVMKGKKITGQKDSTLIINDYDQGCKFLKSVGAIQKSYQETKREIWHLKNTEITLDTWPGLKPLIEIEGKNTKEVKTVSESLGFDWKKAIFWSTDELYKRELGIPRNMINNKYPIITFKNPPKPYKK
ncbi:MAG: hypothetical protein A2Y82_03810 [Candidatus Buchananbacteria bacterium RBG_13_36_9]|uniref:CYTH domain-containing protein n=1 Tax=Candidatus Buchananbacteria bacterium RBG_13_36_9 TaxID=1797530 RepID=A0A1G1XMN9_9BACT|nr:MAG: hypothetical protein A2Y82_03810 [Candidatus Buchananbacteria bacterium RBG_13_36_9]